MTRIRRCDRLYWRFSRQQFERYIPRTNTTLVICPVFSFLGTHRRWSGVRLPIAAIYTVFAKQHLPSGDNQVFDDEGLHRLD